MEFSLSSSPLNPDFLKDQLSSTDSGALVCFNGTVRDHNVGRAVTALEYEAYPQLCAGEMERIFAEARDRFAILQARVVHRTGRLEKGELAVWIGVSAAHRGAAFRACRYLIDELKSRLPIWKKEFYTDGQSGWVSAQTPSASQVLPDIYYSRQISVPGIGRDGQRRLENARVLVVGAGGLGCAALRGLTGSGIGTIGICENDILEESNLARQTLYRHEDIGRPKIDLAVIRLQEINPSLCFIKHPQRMCAANVRDILKEYDLIIDCTDNFPTKFLLNDACVLQGVPLISASLYQTDGQLHSYLPGKTACLRCLWPCIPEPDCVGNCQEAGVLGDLAAVFGHLQSLETIKVLLGFHDGQSKMWTFSALDTQSTRLTLLMNPDCPICGKNPLITTIEAKEYGPLADLQKDIHLIPRERRGLFIYVDVREPYERLLAPLSGFSCLEIPLGQFPVDPNTFKKDRDYLVFCSKGIRSLRAVEILREIGITNAYSLKNSFSEIKSVLTQDG